MQTLSIPAFGSVIFTPDHVHAYAPLTSQNALALLTTTTTCKGLPKIIGENAVDVHAFVKGTFFDGSSYHYGLGSQDPTDPPGCFIGGTVHEEVGVTLQRCPFFPKVGQTIVSELAVCHGGDLSGFENWIPDVIASPSEKLTESCDSKSKQRLEWKSSDGTKTVDLTKGKAPNLIKQDIDLTPLSTITTTSFGCDHQTWYFTPDLPPSGPTFCP